MTKIKLSPQDKNIIQEYVNSLTPVINAIKHSNQFNLGDYVIVEDNGQVVTNAYGTAIKYIVVHKTEEGICFIKRMSSKGNPTGQIMSMVVDVNKGTRFLMDPDYVDAIILENKEGYDGAERQRKQKELRDSITKHNKAIKVSTRDMDHCVNFLANVKVGDILWTSTKKCVTVVDTKQIEVNKYPHRTHLSKYMRQNLSHIVVAFVFSQNGVVKPLGPEDIKWKALYTAQPRSYTELRNLNL